MSEIHTEGLPLFAEPPRARTTDPRTSHDAAASMTEAAVIQRGKILECLAGTPGGLTADAIDALADWRPTTAGRRLVELVRMGLVEVLPVTRPTRSGRAAQVYAITAHQKAA